MVSNKKESKNITYAQVHITAGFNNTMVTFTDCQGNVLSWASAGSENFSGARQSTPFAAGAAAESAANKAKKYGVIKVEVFLKGYGSGRDAAVMALHAAGLIVLCVCDKTPIPHNGCRARKKKRV